MLIKTLRVGPLATNCYIFADESAREAAVVDPGGAAARILSAVEESGLTVKMILLTHGHGDHTEAVEPLREATGAPVYLHPADLNMAGFLREAPLGKTLPLAEGDVLKLGSLEIKVLHTPGHSEGSCVFLVEREMFAGDTLFCGSCGRTDFPGGDSRKMMASLRRLAALEGDYNVRPGHDVQTTLENERRTNYYLMGF